MKFVLTLIAAAGLATGQQTSTKLYDVNGRAVPVQAGSRSESTGASSSSQTVRSLNGRDVPVQQTEERVISESPNEKIIERITRAYDPSGSPAREERTRIEQRQLPDGSQQVVTTVQRANNTGRVQVSERRTELTKRSGADVTSTVAVERPTATGTLDLVEQVNTEVRSVGEGRTSSNTLTSRKDMNGRFREVSRAAVEVKSEGPVTEETRTEYEAITTGTMRLKTQHVTRTVPTSGGGTRVETDVYEPTADGRSLNGDSKPSLVRREIVESIPTTEGSREVRSVQLASGSDPGRLGPERRVEETTCAGPCGRR